jgi:CheY-like chemotaxis protein
MVPCHLMPYHFLIVEDDNPTLEQLVRLCYEEFPYCQVDAASNVRDAIELLGSVDKRHIYNLAILDFALPPSDSQEVSKVDESICLLLRELMPETRVMHISKLKNDINVLGHLQRCHSHAGPALLDKGVATWADELFNFIREYLHRQHISRAVDDIFTRSSSLSGRQDKTHPIGQLTNAIAENWKYLDKPLRAKIRNHLEVDDTGEPVKVSFLEKCLSSRTC